MKKQIMAGLNPENEKKRIDKFLELLDITDNKLYFILKRNKF